MNMILEYWKSDEKSIVIASYLCCAIKANYFISTLTSQYIRSHYGYTILHCNLPIIQNFKQHNVINLKMEFDRLNKQFLTAMKL